MIGSTRGERLKTRSIAPSVDGSLALKLLPAVLSMTAGSVDVIGFLGLGGLFTAHITGNLVILAARVVAGGQTPIAPILSVPVFMLVLAITRLLVGILISVGLASLRPLLLLQLLLLAGFLLVCVAAEPRTDPNTASLVFAGMLGVSAMAVQNALTQISLRGAPSTAVMTTNVTRFTMDIGEMLVGFDPKEVDRARMRANHTWPAIIGFAAGCALGAACEVRFALWALALPVGLALLALTLGVVAKRRSGP